MPHAVARLLLKGRTDNARSVAPSQWSAIGSAFHTAGMAAAESVLLANLRSSGRPSRSATASHRSQRNYPTSLESGPALEAQALSQSHRVAGQDGKSRSGFYSAFPGARQAPMSNRSQLRRNTYSRNRCRRCLRQNELSPTGPRASPLRVPSCSLCPSLYIAPLPSGTAADGPFRFGETGSCTPR